MKEDPTRLEQQEKSNRAQLLFLEGEWKENSISLEDNTPVYFGSSPKQSNLIFSNPAISPLHLSICYDKKNHCFEVTNYSEEDIMIHSTDFSIEPGETCTLPAGTILLINKGTEILCLAIENMTLPLPIPGKKKNKSNENTNAETESTLLKKEDLPSGSKKAYFSTVGTGSKAVPVAIKFAAFSLSALLLTGTAVHFSRSHRQTETQERLTETEKSGTTEKSKKEKEAIESYVKLLTDYALTHKTYQGCYIEGEWFSDQLFEYIFTVNTKFCLGYVDEDDIPDLLLIENTCYDHEAGEMAILSYQNNEIESLAVLGHDIYPQIAYVPYKDYYLMGTFVGVDEHSYYANGETYEMPYSWSEFIDVDSENTFFVTPDNIAALTSDFESFIVE